MPLSAVSTPLHTIDFGGLQKAFGEVWTVLASGELGRAFTDGNGFIERAVRGERGSHYLEGLRIPSPHLSTG